MLPGQVREIGADHLAPFAAGAGGHRHRLPGGEQGRAILLPRRRSPFPIRSVAIRRLE